MPAGFEVFDSLDKATTDVLKEINAMLRSQRVPPKLSKINLDLEAALNQPGLFPADAESEAEQTLAALRTKVRSVLTSIPPEAFKRDKRLKALITAHAQTKDHNALLTSLDEFFIDNDLYRDIAPVTVLEQVKAEDLQLIAFEVFG